MTRTVILINGKPRSGKDTVVEHMQRHLADEGVPTEAFSSIEPVRKMVNALGIDVTRKTEADRILLSEIGDAVEKHSQYRTRGCVEHAKMFSEPYDNCVVFIHVREPENIEKMRVAFKALGFRPIRLYVTGPRAIEVNSKSDQAAGEYNDRLYDYSICNDGTLNDLFASCSKLIHAAMIGR